MDILGTVGASLQLVSLIFKALQTVDGVFKGKTSEPIVSLEKLCGEIQKECETFVKDHSKDVDACNIANQGLAICKELTATISKMHPEQKTAKTVSRAIFQSVWSKDKLVEQQRNLDSCMEALERLTIRRFEEDMGVAVRQISQGNDEILKLITQLYAQALQHRKVGCILDALAFEDMGRRYGRVHYAEAETFRWVLDLKEEAPLAMWLAQDDGIFHVIGKPGSGKSTLMKFIVDEPSTTDLLRQWAGGAKLVQASCFFWKPGNELQNTMMGLIRTLLHGMLQANPDLGKTLFSVVWGRLDNGEKSRLHLSDREIKEAWKLFVNGGSGGSGLSDYRCCFFIDGLDEFGDRNDTIPRLVRDLKEIVQNANGRIKICVSSREYPNIVDGLATKDTHRILLQDLTRDDIAQFVDRRLQDLCDEVPIESSDIQWLRDKILRGAQGVFLWVAIILGMVEVEALNDTPVDKILEMIHKAQHDELDDFLRSVVSRVQKRDRKTVAIMFKFTIDVEQVNHEAYDIFSCYMYLREFDTADNFVAQCRKLRSQLSTEDSFEERLFATHKWIRRSCEGLLDINRSPEDLYDWDVAFTHRTVHEFITALLEDEWHDLVAEFDPAGAVVRMAHALALAHWGFYEPSSYLCLFFDLKSNFTFGKNASLESLHNDFSIALAIEQAIPPQNDMVWPLTTQTAIYSDCYDYIEWKNEHCPRELAGRVWPYAEMLDKWPLDLLLESGASPMDVDEENGCPIWVQFLARFVDWREHRLNEDNAMTMEMFVQVSGPLPIWMTPNRIAVVELEGHLYAVKLTGVDWPAEIPPLGEGSELPAIGSLADLVAAEDLEDGPVLLALLDEREPAAKREERAQRLVQDYEHIAKAYAQREKLSHDNVCFEFGTLTEQ